MGRGAGAGDPWLGGNPRAQIPKLAFFTGRDQSQALTGWWAQQFGTINYAAHGGFCSVNMAAGGLYTVGGSFWEFGEPDWEHTKYLMLWGVAEDHDSNPIKLGLGKLKASGAKFVAVNPVRTGYSAIADEWIGIRARHRRPFRRRADPRTAGCPENRWRIPAALHQQYVLEPVAPEKKKKKVALIRRQWRIANCSSIRFARFAA